MTRDPLDPTGRTRGPIREGMARTLAIAAGLCALAIFGVFLFLGKCTGPGP